MLWRALWIVFLLLPATAVAQVIEVQSGEHDGFSRLVFSLPEGTDWSLETMPARAQVRLDMNTHRFETSRIFDRIPRTRLSDVSQSGIGAPLDITLSCECEVAGFVHSGAWLVIDIKDPASSHVEEVGPAGAIGLQPFRFSQQFPGNWNRLLPLHELEGLALPGRADSAVISVETRATERMLNEQLARAAEQGLVTLKNGRAETEGNTSGVSVSVKPTRQILPGDIPQEIPQSAPVAVFAVTSMDRDMTPTDVEVAGTPARVCLSSEEVDIASWGDGSPYSDQIGRLRAALVGEFDRMDTAAVHDLARALLHFGFGAEAGQALELAPERVDRADVLADLADLVDDVPLGSSSPFLGQQVCDSDAALWAVLAVEEGELRGINERAVLKGFSRLPEHLRLHLAPRLSMRLTEQGLNSTAEQIMRIARRDDSVPNADLDLADAEAKMARGNWDIAEATLSRLVEGNGETTPRALMSLVETHLHNRSAPEPNMPDLIAAFEREYRSSTNGPGLRRAHAVSLGLLNRFEDAFQAVGRISELDGETQQLQAASMLYELLAESGDDIAFLRHAAGISEKTKNALGTHTRLNMARRFLDLGFAAQAERLLNVSSYDGDEEGRSKHRLLSAEAALAQDKPHKALLTLVALKGRDADLLRARALSRTGNFAEAAKIYDTLGDPKAAQRARWSEGDMNAVADAGFASLANAADPDPTEIEEPEPQAGVLAAAHALLSQSDEIRRELDTLFSRIRSPEQ